MDKGATVKDFLIVQNEGSRRVTRHARTDIEHRLGHSVISSYKAIDHITPKDELPFEKEK